MRIKLLSEKQATKMEGELMDFLDKKRNVDMISLARFVKGIQFYMGDLYPKYYMKIDGHERWYIVEKATGKALPFDGI